MKVTLLNYMGSDLTVVNAARVSFNKESSLVASEDGEFPELVLKESDKKLIKYLADHQHWSPFSHCFLSFHIKAPIFVTRQLAKHVVGLSWNEVSRRYVDTPPELYWPTEWRKKATNKKQGSSDETVKDIIISKYSYETTEYGETIENQSQDFVNITDLLYPIAEDSLYAYKRLISNGVCPEQARMILPLNTYTEFHWSGSLYAFARVVNLRTTMDTQKETREIALQIKQIMLELFPESSKALVKEAV
jgi:thymidylate synthase (FAD)